MPTPSSVLSRVLLISSVFHTPPNVFPPKSEFARCATKKRYEVRNMGLIGAYKNLKLDIVLVKFQKSFKYQWI